MLETFCFSPKGSLVSIWADHRSLMGKEKSWLAVILKSNNIVLTDILTQTKISICSNCWPTFNATDNGRNSFTAQFFLSLVTMQRSCKAYYELCSSFCDITLSDMFLGDDSYYVCENIFERRKLTRSCFSPTNNFGEFWSIKNSFLDKKIIEIILCRWIKP